MTGCEGCQGSPTDSRFAAAVDSNASVDPVLGPYLGGGVVGTFLGSGTPARVGGGMDVQGVHLATSPGPAFPAVRHDLLYDLSTPHWIFERRTAEGLNRAFGGLVGGETW